MMEKNSEFKNENIMSADIDVIDINTTEQNLVQMDQIEEQEDIITDSANLDEQIQNNMLRNITLADAEMKMFGDRTILAQIAQLIAYIRYAVKHNLQTDITVSICKSDNTVSDAEFMFDLNGCQVPDLVPQQQVFIN